ncbi:hypothetical protein [Blattabacterium cuenoti]|uniref:hypothetical protein n=1 Tax=Blattabacterium cuenoti TaxID=1653831 RepID=UPI00311F03AA
MKKIFVFIFLLFSIIFFSSCHDEGLSGIIEKSDMKITDINDRTKDSTTPPPNKNEEDIIPPPTTYSLEEIMRRNSTFKRIIEYFNEMEGIKSTSDY